MNKKEAELIAEERDIWGYLPPYWAGGSESWNPNRIRIEKNQEVVGYIEHHGYGEDNWKYPTDEDYADARFIVTACNHFEEMKAALKAFKKAYENSLQLEKTDVAYKMTCEVLAKIEAANG